MIEAFTLPPYSPESNPAHAPHLFSFFIFNKAVSSGSSAQVRTRRKVTNDSTLLTSSNRASNRPHREMPASLNEEERSVLGDFEYNGASLAPSLYPEWMKWRIRQASGIASCDFNQVAEDEIGASVRRGIVSFSTGSAPGCGFLPNASFSSRIP
jgi:hypothetical protein